jgi:hypothetical protein
VLKQYVGQELYLPRHACRCVQRLIAAELWDLWPWQLEVSQQLKQLEQEQKQQDIAGCASTSKTIPISMCYHLGSSSSSSSSSGSSQQLRASVGVGVVTPLLPQVMPLLATNSSSSSSQSPAPPTCQLPPVTQQQLQLALEWVCVTVELSPQETRSGLLLLMLLLLRAEPSQRLAFLNGPCGGLLLAALQLYACDRMPLHGMLEAIVPGLAVNYPLGFLATELTGAEGFVEALTPGVQSHIVRAESSAVWILDWILLQPRGCGDTAACLDSSSSSSSSSGSGGGGGARRTTSRIGLSWRASRPVQCGTQECRAGA